ncbi:SRPBCC family protein [Cellulomonas palmilytica]|uniref:SRPBCC family protein n=1 Tax=Cellulomonas palmilytica TaxID=2608402 RepID=UPI001F3CCA0B|nr:SRPBCC family protein [Cellulomonas palmilytica]UJP41374.1 SRPBCC family protein [Cellulomonas palmilytica]
MTLPIDPVATAGLVTREVRPSERSGAPTKIAVARREYPTDPADLWNALTDPERIPRWFLPVTGDLRVGGRYSLAGNASGVVERCDAPRLLALTWEMGPQVSWLEVELTPSPGGTTFELRHEAHVDPELWAQFGPGAVGIGWDLALVGLGLHLASGAAVDPDEGAGYPLTPEGTTFVRAAAQAWTAAAVAAGEDPEAMAAASEGAVAFYTVAPEPQPGADGQAR